MILGMGMLIRDFMTGISTGLLYFGFEDVGGNK